MLAGIFADAMADARAFNEPVIGALVNSGSKLEVSVSELRVGLNGGMMFLRWSSLQSMSAKNGCSRSSLAS